MLVSGTLHGAGAKNVNMHLCEKNSYVKKCLGLVTLRIRPNSSLEIELIIVNDGSVDDTENIVVCL